MSFKEVESRASAKPSSILTSWSVFCVGNNMLCGAPLFLQELPSDLDATDYSEDTAIALRLILES